jgi:hypothetical protein
MSSFGSTSRNTFQQAIKSSSDRADQPADQQERISYGEIIDVNKDSQVKVKMYRSKERGEIEIMGGSWMPLLQPLSVVHHLYGRLHKGMKVRIFWTGKHEPTTAIIEVIGGKDHDIIIKSVESNRVDTLAYKTISGGLGGVA